MKRVSCSIGKVALLTSLFFLVTLGIQHPVLNATPVEWSLADGGNGHYYELVLDTLLWDEAKLEAENQTYLGQQGYLATITSPEEQEFLNSLNPTNIDVWLGASDSESEGIWKWVVGPEAGQLLSETFENWAAGEPNNFQNEDYLIGWWRDGTGQQWNDGANNRYRGYVVEFGPVPIPAAVWLLGSGLIGLAGIRRKQ